MPHYMKEIYRAYFKSQRLNKYKVYFVGLRSMWILETKNVRDHGIEMQDFIDGLVSGKYSWWEE